MINLTETQRLILTAATARPDRLALPLPAHIKGGAAKKVVTGLLTRGLVEEVPATGGAPVWRAGDDGAAVTLVATDAAFAALGLTPPMAEVSASDADGTEPAGAPVEKPRVRAGTKQAQMIAMLEAPEGATVPEIAEATGWQQHTVRGAIAGALKKRLGLNVASEKIDGRGRVYRVGA